MFTSMYSVRVCVTLRSVLLSTVFGIPEVNYHPLPAVLGRLLNNKLSATLQI